MTLLAQLQEAHRGGEDFRFASELVMAWPQVEALIEAAQDALFAVQTRRVGVGADGSQQYAQPVLAEVDSKLRAALAAFTEETP